MGPFASLVSLLTALPAGAGIGGGGLFIIYLTSCGLPPTESAALNLIFYLAAAVSSLPFHLRNRKVNFKAAFIAAALGIMGTFIGGWLRYRIPEGYLRLFFGVLLIFTGFRSLFRKKITNFPTFPSTRE